MTVDRSSPAPPGYAFAMFTEVGASSVPWVTTEQMREVDRVMIDELGIELIQMMEMAGRNLAHVAVERFAPESVVVLAGTGGNGGGAMVAARHLANRGVTVGLTVTDAARLGPVPRHQYEILLKMGVAVSDLPMTAELVVDGLIGYSLSGAPHGRAAELIDWTGGQPVLSLDVPSGLDATSGDVGGPMVTAAATLTLAAPKIGMANAPSVGDLYLGDISVPPSVFADLGFDSLEGLGRAPVVRIVDPH